MERDNAARSACAQLSGYRRKWTEVRRVNVRPAPWAEEVSADCASEEVTERQAASSADVTRGVHVRAIATRPPWSADVDPPRVCEARGCDRPAVACLVASDRAYCRPHAELARRTFPDRLIVPLVDCAWCGRQGPLGLELIFEGENLQRLCRGCAELVRATRRVGGAA
jgi:hypothetical protein